MSEEKMEQLPAVALRGLTIVPGMVIHFDLSRGRSIKAVEEAMAGSQRLFVSAQKDMDIDEPGFDDIYEVGTIVLIRQITKLPNHIVRVLVEGRCRASLQQLEVAPGEYLLAGVKEITQEETEPFYGVELEACLREVRECFEKYSQFFPKIGKSISSRLAEIGDLEVLVDEIVGNIPLRYDRKQQILETIKLRDRFTVVCRILQEEAEIAKVKNDLAEKIRSKVEKNQRDYLLREQLRFIREELGEEEESEAERFENAVSKLKASKDVKDKIKKEISRFRNLSASSSESAVERAYIETLLELPWDKVSKDYTDIAHAEEVLEKGHYGLDQVKERILEFLAVRALTQKGDSPILCLVGPPGTGKTSIAKSVAQALEKKYVRICLGGVRDESEIRGHRKTYVGAMPGRIVGALKQAGVKNPLILLDEIDKVGKDQRGDTASALLEVLDGEQNAHFRDHYVEIPVDLSEVLFLATANSVSTIPKPLLDRMEIIEVTSYTANEKFHIAKEHLLEKQLEKNGISQEQLEISDNVLRKMINSYTREAGVRELERKIAQICRKSAREILKEAEKQEKEKQEAGTQETGKQKAEKQETRQSKSGKAAKKIRVTCQNLEKYLGKERYAEDRILSKNEVGMVRGLAWTSVGGDTLEIEVNIMPGKGELELTGQMGEVMKESALTGISYIRSIASSNKISADAFKKNDFHIHIPEGAVPKDGPSAGITMATAVFSALTKTPVYANVAMTGEITLRGRVLPIGGLKEKMLAAKTAGVKKVIVPCENKKDVEEISVEIKTGLEIVFVETMDEVLEHALVKG